MRKSCTDCCRKHLAQALVISHELAWYAYDEDDNHLWVCVGHLAEAEAQIQKLSLFIADQIRNQRLMLIKEGAESAMNLGLNTIINMVTELDRSMQSPLGLEPDDSDILDPTPSG